MVFSRTRICENPLVGRSKTRRSRVLSPYRSATWSLVSWSTRSAAPFAPYNVYRIIALLFIGRWESWSDKSYSFDDGGDGEEEPEFDRFASSVGSVVGAAFSFVVIVEADEAVWFARIEPLLLLLLFLLLHA